MHNKIKHYIDRIKNGRLDRMREEIKWIYGYGRTHILSVVLYTLLGLTATAVGLFSSLVSRDLVDIITGHNSGELIRTFLLIIGTTILNIFLTQLSVYLSAKINMKVDNAIKADIYDKIMVTEWEALNSYHSGDLLTRWMGDVSRISGGLLNLAPNLIIYLCKFLGALIMVVRYDASFAVFALASVPVSLIFSKKSLKMLQKHNMSTLNVGAKMNSFSQETFSNLQTVKAFDMVGLYSSKLRSLP